MDIMNALVDFGSEAVLRYRTISRQQDNEVPEVFLGGFIAPHLHDQFDCPVHIEHNYLCVASNLEVAITPDLVKKVGYFRADIAMYPDGLPPVIIELKVFDEGCQPSSVLGDLLKIKKLSDICTVKGYIGVLICATTTVPLEERVRKLEETLARRMHRADPQQSADGNWRWCYGCASLSVMPQV
jgi:hypothetical protein